MPTQVINTRYEVIETDPRSETTATPFLISKARDVVEGRVVTLEVLPPDRIPVGATRDEVRAAVSEAMRLDHPSICRVYDQGENAQTGDLYVVSEYVRGITLQERIRRVAPFSLTVATDIAVSVVEALDCAHRDGVIHGDLRPQSVLLSPEGQIKVAQFAYARAASAGARILPTVGDDIRAAGALLSEMLTGSEPPKGEGAGPPSPRASNTGVPPALDGIVQKALHPDPVKQYRSAQALLLDLQAVRDALRTGRPLAGSLLSDRRSPRPSASDAAIPADLGVAAGGATTPLAAAADEIDKERDMPERRERSSPLSKVLAVLFVLAVLSVIAIVWYGSKALTIPNDIQVPNLIGKTMDEAKQAAVQQHFTLVEGGSDYSTKWPEDQIYQQDPLPGRTIKAEKEVSVFRSLGPRLLKIPRLVGETKDRAVSDLQDVGLPEGTVTEEYSETIQRGVVIRQTPDAASMVSRNTAINFTVSKGRQPPDPPGSVDAEATASDTVSLHWDQAPRAESYTVYRLLNGDTTTVAKGLVDTHFTDRGLTPDTSYSYTVDAVNMAGASGAGEPALVTTPAKPVASPVLPKNTTVVTPSIAPGPAPTLDGTTTTAPPPPSDSPPPAARMRQFTIGFRVPRHPRKPRHVQFEVQDVTGTNLVYDETHQPGDEVSAPVQGFGNKVTLRIFLDGSLVKQQTL